MLNGLYPVPITDRGSGEVITGDVVDVADRQPAGHPRHMLEILSWDDDDVFYLDLSRPGADDEVPVVFRSASAPNQSRDEQPNFADFLEWLLAQYR